MKMKWLTQKMITWDRRITVTIVVLFLILIGPTLVDGDTAQAKDTWRRWLAYPYSSLIHQGGSTGGVMSFTSSANFYQVPNYSSCGFGGPGGCFSYIFDYDADDNPIFGTTQASFQMNGQYACALFEPNYGSFGIEMFIDGISSGYQNYSGTSGGQSRCTVTRSPGYHTVTIRWAGGYLQNGWVYGTRDTTPPVTTASHTESGASATVTSTATEAGGLINHHWCRVNGGAWVDSRASTCPINVDIATHGAAIDFEYYAQDYVGNNSAVQSYSFSLDNIPPDLSDALEIHGAPSGTWANISNTPGFTFTATDNPGGSGVRGFYVYFGDDPNGTSPTLIETTGFDLTPYQNTCENGGTYYLRVVAEDWAGNQSPWTTLFEYRHDNQPPQSGFQNPPEGATFEGVGTIVLGGASTDLHSGVHRIEMSLNDGATWFQLEPQLTWEYEWDTTSVPDGFYHIMVRALDYADNQENTAHANVTVKNGLPDIFIDNWIVGQGGDLSIDPKADSLTYVSVTYGDYDGRWSITKEWDDGNYARELYWDRFFGYDGTGGRILAPIGNYPVTIRATNNYGNSSEKTVQVRIPDPGPAPKQVLPVKEEEAPDVMLTSYWKIWEGGNLFVTPGSSALSRVIITIRDDQGRWESVTHEFGGENYPLQVFWDRFFGGDEQVSAPIGTYTVFVEAYNEQGLKGSAQSIIEIPAPEITEVRVAPTPVGFDPVVEKDPYIKPLKVVRLFNILWVLPLMGIFGLVFVFSSSGMVDRRPDALNETKAILEGQLRLNKEAKEREEDE